MALIYITPPRPDADVHEVNEVLLRFIRSPSVILEWIIHPFPSFSVIFANEHDVMDTLHPLSTRMIGEERLSVVDALTLTDLRASVPLDIEKREYPIDGKRLLYDTTRGF